MKPFDPTQFITPKAKPLPVILLLDCSGSMGGDKIRNLNDAVRDMIGAFTDNETSETEIHTSIITFGAAVKLQHPLSSAHEIKWHELEAGGGTPLGTALKMAKAMIEDKEVIPSRAYRPTVILVSDGQPTDEWESPLKAFVSEGRSSKCDRMAMAIGADADEIVLGKFIEGTKKPLFYAENAKQLRDFFKFVTMSVTSRTQSVNPNLLPEPETIEVQPITIEARTINPTDTSVPKQLNDGASDQTNGEGYW